MLPFLDKTDTHTTRIARLVLSHQVLSRLHSAICREIGTAVVVFLLVGLLVRATAIAEWPQFNCFPGRVRIFKGALGRLRVVELHRRIMRDAVSLRGFTGLYATDKADEFRRLLKTWFAANARNLPWRAPGTSAWHVLLAEVLLQKTNTAKVVGVYEALAQAYQEPAAVAAAGIELEAHISKLGLLSRASRLRAIARTIAQDFGGQVPSTVEDLESLPGVGRYTASAVMCFAYGQAVPLVDVNVIRVFRRVFSLEVTRRSNAERDRNVWVFAQSLVPAEWAREYNAALLDFGALVCTSRRPRCDACPLSGICDTHRTSSGSPRLM